MATDPGFLDHISDLFAELGPLRRGRLFGGTALYIGDAMFAVIFGDQLFMKSDATLKPLYEAAGSTAFVYGTKTGERSIAGLMSLPDSALDDPDEAVIWARRSLIPAEAVAKNRKPKARKKAKS